MHGGWVAGAFVADACCVTPHAETDTDTFEKFVSKKALLQSFDNIAVDPYKFEALPIDNAIWTQVADSSPDSLFKLFWFTAQKTQYWGSDGDADPSPPIKVTGARCEPPYFLADANRICIEYASQSPGAFFAKDGAVAGRLPENLWPQSETPLHRPCQIRKTNKKSKEMMSRAIARHTLASVSGLYRLFWDQTHDNDGDGYGILTDCDDGNASVFPGSKTTCGYGLCAVTVASCSNSTVTPCTPLNPPEPGEETSCDGLDNDCNGETDENCVISPFTDDSINHDPTCNSGKPMNNKLPTTPDCIAHAQDADGIHWVHDVYDIKLSVASSSRVSSSATLVTVTPSEGFTGDITVVVEDIYMDNEPAAPATPDGLPDGPALSVSDYPLGSYFYFKVPGGTSVRSSVTLHYPDYRFKFFVNLLPTKTPYGRYIIVLKATSDTNGDGTPDVTAHERILLVVEKGDPGYVIEL
jgi:hypothetical protein